MKKIASVYILFLVLCLCGCQNNSANSQTRFLLNTVATLTADTSDEVLDGAFGVCQNYEKKLSRTLEDSEISILNRSLGFTETDSETLKIIERSLYYSKLSDGKFDITILPLSSLWDFENKTIPSKDEIAEALKNVDYEAIEINGNSINLNGKKIDLGSIAKGYIADKVLEFFKEKNVKNGIINLGGNIIVFGKEYNIGIKKPFSEEIAATLRLRDKSVVTSGIYERYIKENGKIYHHILDTDTGYGVESDLASVTVIGNSSMDCDALSTVCMLLGKQKGEEIIAKTPSTEAVFIDRDGNLTYTDGIYKKGSFLYLK